MHNLKVWSFHPNSRNAIIFMGLSVLFLILQQSLQSGLPFMNGAFLKKVVSDEWPVLLFLAPALYTTAKQYRIAPNFFALFTASVVFRSLEGLFLDFNKLVLLVLFFHIMMSYGFYQLLNWTYSRASFSPNFRSDNLHIPMGRSIHAQVVLNDQILSGRLTNWDSDGAFVWLEGKLPTSATVVELLVSWEGHSFKAKGTIVSATWDGQGIGIEWEHTTVRTEEGWDNLMALFEDYGYEPQLLR